MNEGTPKLECATRRRMFKRACRALICALPPSLLQATPASFEVLHQIPYANAQEDGYNNLFNWTHGGGRGFLSLPDKIYRFSLPLRSEGLPEVLGIEGGNPEAIHASGDALLVLNAMTEAAGGFVNYRSTDHGQTFEDIPGDSVFNNNYMRVSGIQQAGCRLYCDWGSGPNLFVSDNGGLDWMQISGEPSAYLAYGTFLVAGQTVLFGGVSGYETQYIARGRLNEQGTSLESELDWTGSMDSFSAIRMFAHNAHTETILACGDSRILRSQDDGVNFDPVSQSGFLNLLLLSSKYARHALGSGVVEDGNGDMVIPYAALSQDDGRSWRDAELDLSEYGQRVVLLEEDIDGRILLGIDAPGENGGLLTIGELKLPDPVLERIWGAQYSGYGWWESADFGKFNALWYPAIWRNGGWLVHAEEDDGVFWDAEAGWLRQLPQGFVYAYAPLRGFRLRCGFGGSCRRASCMHMPRRNSATAWNRGTNNAICGFGIRTDRPHPARPAAPDPGNALSVAQMSAGGSASNTQITVQPLGWSR
jgi:hypothetical protein